MSRPSDPSFEGIAIPRTGFRIPPITAEEMGNDQRLPRSFHVLARQNVVSPNCWTYVMAFKSQIRTI